MIPRRHLIIVAAAAAAVLMAACGVASDTVPRDVPEVDRSPFLGAATPTPGSAAGTDRIFLLAPETATEPRRLRAAQRDVGASAPARLTSLFGALSLTETTARLRTALPETLQLLSATLQTNGTLIVDVTDPILSLSSNALIDAVAQIVFTAAEVRNVQRVQILVDGVARQWPGGDGSLRSIPLTVYDYPGFIETTQPDFPALPSPAA
ncbi:unannotated protein [freshwater metagenome]|uniref:Unannotated protein n=1 Tax=freshwater metagenome TaxID=449393 RepID=A0A6J7E4R0_9ZZZZ|nr:hypothetical protein [Actinomycetota bacterium]